MKNHKLSKTINVVLDEGELRQLRYYCWIVRNMKYTEPYFVKRMTDLYEKLDKAAPDEWKVKRYD
jgi:hypothetical protein